MTAQQQSYQSITVSPVNANIGAVVGAVHLGAGMDFDQLAEIRSALTAHKVLFFRDQLHAGDTEHKQFAEQLGIVTKPHPTIGGDSGEVVLPIDSLHGKANSWHTDMTFVDRPPSVSILRAVSLPDFGGTTVWANTTRAYETLHPALKALADNLWAVHCNLYDYAADQDEKRIGGIDVKEQNYRAEFGHQEFETEHPVVRVHPLSGERTLLLGHFVRHFVGMAGNDSRELFSLLQRRVTRLDNTVRWSWRPGDLAMWDNQATQHYAVDDYADQPRRMHRITLAGDIPVGIDGRVSQPRKGDASSYSVVAQLAPA
jgi:alpha-ketoglutarate-dependent taurine dioxygenase